VKRHALSHAGGSDVVVKRLLAAPRFRHDHGEVARIGTSAVLHVDEQDRLVSVE
jgi:hypothetical protein